MELPWDTFRCMCGLVFSTDVSVLGTSAWDNAMATLRCRGPESHGCDARTGMAAGHRRLEIIGLGSVGSQPHTDHAGDDVLVYNGEIYNYAELAADLRLEAKSDTHVLYHLLRTRDWGRLGKLRGMYAFVYHDATTNELITARDPFGIKPLYMLKHPDGHLSFASVAAALARFPGAREPDPLALTTFLAAGYIPAGRSAFRQVQKMPPGEIRHWRRGSIGWDYQAKNLTLSSWSARSVRVALADSVAAHMVSDVPVGVLLSGGVDSTLIAALASKHTQSLRTYSLTNPDHPDINEAEFARWNARLLGAEHTEVPVRAAELASQIMPLIESSGEPFGDAAYLPLSLLCERVAQDIKVVLAGEGADELFGGYRRYDVERLQAGLARYPARLTGLVLRGDYQYATRERTQRVRALASLATKPGLASHSLLMGADWDLVREASPGVGEQAWAEALSRWADLTETPLSLGMPANRVFDLREWLTNVYLEKSDRASMLHSLEVRVPFLDPEVALAASLHSPRDSSKQPLREELNRLLPKVKLPQHKKGLSVASAELVALPEMQDVIDEELNSSSSLLLRMEVRDRSAIAAYALLHPSTAFRVAMLGLWRRAWLT